MENVYIRYWRGRDFEEAVILVAAGAVLDSVEWDRKSEIATFVFEDEFICKNILTKHKRKELWLLSQDFLNAYREVKNELYRDR